MASSYNRIRKQMQRLSQRHCFPLSCCELRNVLMMNGMSPKVKLASP
jgi:hypothetical protein